MAFLLFLVTVGMALGAISRQEEQGIGGVFVAAAWVSGVGLVVWAVRRRRSRGDVSGIPLAVVVVPLVAFATFTVVYRPCEERLGPGGDLAGCDFAGVDLAGTNLRGADLTEAALAEADLSGADLRTAALSGADLSGANLQGANLGEATLAGANLRSANLDGAELASADLTEADMAGAALRGAVLTGARAERADLTDADMTQASMAGTVLRGAILDGAVLDQIVAEGADLSDASLAGTRLEGAVLERAILAGASLEGVRGQSILLSDANLSGAYLTDVDLRSADLNQADLSVSAFEAVNLERAELIGASGLPDETLASGLGVDRRRLGGFLTQNRIRLEERRHILRALGPVCRGRSARQASGYPGGAFHPLVILDANGRSTQWSNQGESLRWEPMAARFAQLVACVGEVDRASVQVCPYSTASGPAPSITRYQLSRRVRLVTAAGAREVWQRTYQGGAPDECPFTASFYQTEIEGSGIPFGRIKADLAPHVR